MAIETIHADLMKKLGLPCKFVVSEEFKIGGHVIAEDECFIHMNPNVNFERPEHLILHEAAHHIRVIANKHVCCWILGGHCTHWAKTLLRLYRKAGAPLPHSTGFPTFAAIAGIQKKVFGK